MIEIGDKPILWHIMKLYSAAGINDFVICLGYRGYVIKDYFANYFLHSSDVTFDLKNNKMEVHAPGSEPWKVTLVDTGANSMTGGRVKRAAPYIGNEDFCMTYGDGVADVDIRSSIEFHQSHEALATLTAVQPQGRFGAVRLEGAGNIVTEFAEKPAGDGLWINGGFFVLSPGVMDYIQDDDTIWERGPMELLTERRQLAAFIHKGFWHAMDTMRDKALLDELWSSGKAPWKVWK
jgi:glucose-1-phosphate cytidylyltransferase